MSFGAYAMKNERNVVPVDPCPGWVNPCDFCDRRFGDWIDASEDYLAKIPTRCGIFQIAFKSKNAIEIMNIILHSNDVQKAAYETVDDAKEIIADKKSKFSKTVIVCRWMIFKKVSGKDIAVQCAHWYNNGVLPKFLKSWPGLDILHKTDCLTFSEKLQKWCYPKKETFWKKPKPMTTKSVEVIKSCTFAESCEICDASFSEWERLDDVIANDTAPYAAGIYMLAVCCRQKVEVVEIGHGPRIVINIKKSLDRHYYPRSQILKRPEYFRKNAYLLVRWMKFKNPESENCCYVYSHWLNAGKSSCHQYQERKYWKNQTVCYPTYDNKWCYETDVFKQRKTTKFKQRKKIFLNDLEEEIVTLL
ncbi:hypothetical protein AVEN_41702-1 [Araneus ventricosus]|uniref:Uncharacterized protein n=1 Tax=Araneus ventricosus TaxID=182803 RepID=A0A4Y2PTS5_ARAVE|nr:hypothetical protein AVEN_41702-1 [Araneus ventricosus]